MILAISALASLLGPFCRRLIDKLNLRYLLGLLDFGRAAAIIIFLRLIEIYGISSALVYSYAAISAVLGLIYRPSTGAFMPRLVGVKNIVRANSVMGMLYSLTGIAGYFFGGVIVAFYGAVNALYLNAATFIVMGFIFLTLSESNFYNETNPADPPSKPQGSTLSLLKTMVGSGIIAIPMVIVATGIAMAPFRVEWPRLLSALDGGLFLALVALGAMIATFVIDRWEDCALNQSLVLVCLFSLTALVLLPVLTTSRIPLMGVGILLGFVTDFVSSATYSALQVQMPAQYRGRFFGLMEPMERLPLFLVFVLIGQADKHFSTSTIFVWCALSFAVCAGIVSIVVIQRSVFAKARETIRDPA
ncbi:MAG: MFS transporter [Hyphomicrobiales bacterium]